ncbi:spore germination protein (amino acid permease) [Paenibacillus barengoltzii]|uniref:GerAB/ArcD/ProY family transporter n=1 Tax=Paenibacillus barengoltzii TaxID=343517 RepID=UPI000A08E8AF|nr:endospore germination permease [Paenibacillus barengoltzii]SMF59507.1 spore germination protein (amino acid permease) [Paenibacillus barengoltzii]
MDHKASARIGIFPAFSIIILAVGLMNHVMVIPPLLQDAKRDAWLSVLLVLPPYIVWTIILYYIMKKTNQQALIPWLKQNYGNLISGGVRACFIIYLFLIMVVTVKDTTMWTHASYLPKTPQLVLSGSLVFLCCFAVHSGIRAIAISSGILLPFVVIFGDFVMSANLPEKNYSLLTPILENGLGPILRGCMYVGGGLVEVIMILLFQHQMKPQVRPWSICLLAIFLVLLVFGPVTGAISEFGPTEAANLRYPAYEEWRLVSVGKYIQHVDFLSIYQWLSGAFVRISLSLYLLIDLLPANRKKSHKLVWLSSFAILLLVLVELPFSDMQYVNFLKQVYLPLSLAAVTGMLFLLLLIVLMKKNGAGVKT